MGRFKLMLTLACVWLVLLVLPEFSDAQAGPSRCSVGSKPGVCIAQSSCAAAKGSSKPGLCQGDAGIQCCYNIPCSASTGGSCNWKDMCTGKSTPNLCPGPANFQCCEASASPSPTSAPCGGRPCGESSTSPSYVALGDSYAAGLGSTDDYDDEEHCKRSPVAYPKLAAKRLGAVLDFKACSGGEIPQVLDQLNQLTTGQWLGVEYVTLSVGGNDVGFRRVLEDCAKTTTCNVTNVASDIDKLRAKLVDVYKKVKNLAQNAVVVVTGYPRIFSEKVCNVGEGLPDDWSSHFTKEELGFLNGLADKLAVTMSSAVKESGGGIRFLDIRNAYAGHAICTDDPWINNISYECKETWHGICTKGGPSDESMHPTSKGQEVYANLVYSCLTGGACS